MKIELLYGHEGIVVDVPDDISVTSIHKNTMTPLDDPSKAVEQALESPVGSASISVIAQGKKTACILICDVTRPVPNSTLLPPLVDKLTGAGIAKEDILILVATGLHRPNEGEELKEIVGSEEVFQSTRIENHFARAREDKQGFPHHDR